MFYKKQYVIEGKIKVYLERLEDVIFDFREALSAYFEKNKNFETRVHRIEELESELDTLRREIQVSMYEQSLMPGMREDILYLMNSLDQIPNLAEHMILDLYVEQPDIPESLHSDLNSLMDKICKEVKELIVATELLFTDLRSVRRHATEVMREESEADEVEFSLMHSVFSMNIDLAHKLQLKMLIRAITDISDYTEDAAETVLVIATKHAQ
ncbi:DUF47 family protein [Deltaproteobacteria bacterium TL4]